MSVTLDSIQFYHGPSKPTKQSYFTFNSTKDGTAAMPSVCPAAVANESVLATDHRGSLPATHPEETMNQHAVHSSNLFDVEIAKTWQILSSSPTLDDTGEHGACPLTPTPDYHHQEYSVLPSRALCKTVEPETSNISSRSSSSSSSPSLLQTDSAGVPLSISTDMIRELSPSSSTNSEESFHMYTPSDEAGSSISFSSISPQPGLASKAVSERSTPPFTHESGPSDYLAVPHRPSTDSSLWDTSVSGSAEPVSIQHAGMSDVGDMEQAPRCGSASSDSETTSVQKHVTRIRKQRQETKETSPVRRDGITDRRYASVAVVIPPPRRYHLRSLRSLPEHIPSDGSQSEGSADNDDSDDDDYPIDTVTSQASEIETHQVSMGENSRSIRSSSRYTGPTSHTQSTRQYGGNDVIGRAILTIETLGPAPTYFLTFMPDTPGLMPHVPKHSPRASKEPTKISKRVTRRCSAPVKGKRRLYSTDEDILLAKLKEEQNLTWEEITRHFPGRRLSSLQVHYSTKLNPQRSNGRNGQGQRGAKRGNT